MKHIFGHAFRFTHATEEFGEPAWTCRVFALMGRRLHTIIRDELGTSAAERFVESTYDWATHYIWAVPRHDGENFLILLDNAPTSERSESENRKLRHLSGLERTEWLVVGSQDYSLRDAIKDLNDTKIKPGIWRSRYGGQHEALFGLNKTMLIVPLRSYAIQTSKNLVSLKMTELINCWTALEAEEDTDDDDTSLELSEYEE